MSSFRGLSVGMSAVFANQRALDVTSHNISNVNTPGYTRQLISNSSSFYHNIGKSGNGKLLQMGYGVDVQEIRQYRDEFLDKKFKKENTSLGYWGSRFSSIEELETIFNDNSEDGLQAVMNNFWDSWEQLSKPTGGLTVRSMVKENGIAFVETVKNMDNMLINFRRSKDREISECIDRVNEIAKKIANLNLEISKIESHGVTANDLRDERNYLIDELTGKAKIQVYEGSSINISLEGRMLVEGSRYDQIEKVPDTGNSGFIQLVWKGENDRLEISGGSIMALFESRDVLVEGFRERLNQYVTGVAREINAIHITGYGIKDSAHRYFFINSTDGTANNIDISTIAFNPELNEFDNIASAEEAFNYEDNRIALKIAELRHNDYFSYDCYETIAANRQYNFDEFFRNIISDLGNKGQEAFTAVEAQKLLVDQIEFRRQAMSAVSIDEEMCNLIRYEHSYNAAARIVNVVDEMLELVVNRIGVVGR
ncbi:MAG TPA: flagellar hook-associated protein FlgK [Bacillota bacterium]|nr:flagellar hook-associated protein FlgK [Bacillota bacterium]HOR84904.1 flagellar hook-associated protein FlgK [Bacillota bacterium]HPL54023.1 flagellar hook-associated protein FlgK [Bacillota bacterium]